MEERFITAKKIAIIGICANVILLIIKLLVGYASDSRAMIADGLNSTGDVFASTVTLVGSIYAAKPQDDEHLYGHGKAEYIASLIIGFSMIVLAIYSAFGSATALSAGESLEFSGWLVVVAVVTIITKFSLYVYCVIMNKKHGSLLIHANAQDHKNDVLVTIGTLVAIFLSLAGIIWADGLAGLIISAWIAYTGIDIIKSSVKVLMDTGVSKDVLDIYYNDIKEIDDIDHIDSVYAKPVGAKFLLIVKISVNRDMHVLESHKIAKAVENKLLKNRKEIEDVVVHINPDLPHKN